MPYLTGDSPPSDDKYCRTISVPNDRAFRIAVAGAILDLTYAYNWEQHGTMTPEEAAAIMQAAYFEFVDNPGCKTDKEPPFWDDPDGGDADDDDPLPDAPWYEQLGDWLVTAFLAVTFTPGAAIVYKTTIPRLRLAFRTGDAGAIVRVLIDSIEIWTGVTLTPLRDLLEIDLDLEAFAALHSLTPPYEMRIEHAGHPEGLTESKLEVIRKRLWEEQYQMGCNCPPSQGELQDYISRNSAAVQRNIEVWDGNANSIHAYASPIQNFDTGGFGSDKSAVNCAASCAWVEAQVWNVYVTMVALFYTAAAAGTVAWLAGPLGLVLGAASVMIAGMAASKVQAAVNDEAALDSIGCQLAGLLAGDAATQPNFATAVYSLTSATANEATIVAICRTAGGAPGFYNYLSFWGEAEKYASQGYLLDCCCDDPCSGDYDFTIGLPSHITIENGQWEQGVGITSAPNPPDVPRWQILVEFDEPCNADWRVRIGFTSAITHEFSHTFGQRQPDGSYVWGNGADWQGNNTPGTYEHGGNTTSPITYDAMRFWSEDNTQTFIEHLWFNYVP